MSNRITHVRMSAETDSAEHIVRVKGTNSNGNWENSVPEVVSYLKTGNYSFYVHAANRSINVTHQKSAAGNEYIKTEPDSTKRDNLLSLPRF